MSKNLVKKSKRRGNKYSDYEVRRELKGDCAKVPHSIWQMEKSYKFAEDTHTLLLQADSALTTTGGGVLGNVIPNDPSVCSLWALLAQVYDEYRVLSMRIKFRPNQFNGSAITQTVIASVVDKDNGAVMASYLVASQYASMVEHPGGTPWSHTLFIDGVEDAGWKNSSAVVSDQWIKLFSTGNTATTDMGRLTYQFLVQFRGTD
jgi:hypothetical protein